MTYTEQFQSPFEMAINQNGFFYHLFAQVLVAARATSADVKSKRAQMQREYVPPLLWGNVDMSVALA